MTDAEDTFKKESFYSEVEYTREQYSQSKIYDPKTNEAFLENLKSKGEEKRFLDAFHPHHNKYSTEKRISLLSESECSANSTKVETDSLGLDEDDFTPLIIQDFKDAEAMAFSRSLLESNSIGGEHKNRTSTKKEEVPELLHAARERGTSKHYESLSIRDNAAAKQFESQGIPRHREVVEFVESSPATSLTGSSQDVSDSASVSGSESITNLRSNLHTKVRPLFISPAFFHQLLMPMMLDYPFVF